MKLSFAPRTRSVRPRWLLEELEVPYELVRVDLARHEHTTPAFLAASPLGEVPVLVDGALTLFESPAMCLYLADRFADKGLAPTVDSPHRGDYLQWLLFAETRLEPLVLEYLPGATPVTPRPRLEAVLTAIERRVTGRPFIVGDSFTAADLVMASILHLANTLKLLEQRPVLFEYVHRHTARPAARRAVSG